MSNIFLELLSDIPRVSLSTSESQHANQDSAEKILVPLWYVDTATEIQYKVYLMVNDGGINKPSIVKRD